MTIIIDRAIDRCYQVTVRWFGLLALAAGGCTAIYDAQYDDRADELEQSRSEFAPASDRVQFLTAAESKAFWVSLEKPLDEPLLHSLDPSTGTRIDYEFSRADSNIEQRYHMSSQLIVRCSFGTTSAFSATASNVPLGTTSDGNEVCAIDRGDVYFAVGRAIRRWRPSEGPPVQVVDLAAAHVGTGSVDGFGVLGNDLVLAEGGRLWLIDLSTGVATWLENENSAFGTVTFDARGAIYDSPNVGIIYLRFSDHSALRFGDAVADGGYHLNFKHDDIQTPVSGGALLLHDDHVVYRGSHGIFAYGLDTKKVVDLLLDRGESFDTKPRYDKPAITADGTLFVQDLSDKVSNDHPVYRVDLTGRLR